MNAIVNLNTADANKVASQFMKDFRADTLRVDHSENHAIFITTEFYVNQRTKTFNVYSVAESLGGAQTYMKVRAIASVNERQVSDLFMFRLTRRAYVKASMQFGNIAGTELERNGIVEINSTIYVAMGKDESELFVLKRQGSGDDVEYVTHPDYVNDPDSVNALVEQIAKYVKRIQSNSPVLNARQGRFNDKLTLYGQYLEGKGRQDRSMKVYELAQENARKIAALAPIPELTESHDIEETDSI